MYTHNRDSIAFFRVGLASCVAVLHKILEIPYKAIKTAPGVLHKFARTVVEISVRIGEGKRGIFFAGRKALYKLVRAYLSCGGTHLAYEGDKIAASARDILILTRFCVDQHTVVKALGAVLEFAYLNDFFKGKVCTVYVA